MFLKAPLDKEAAPLPTFAMSMLVKANFKGVQGRGQKPPNTNHCCLLQNKPCKNPNESVIDAGNLTLYEPPWCMYYIYAHRVYINY